ncbi:MAG: RagB/SusD family nutrient uptake outer membrane protein [Ferruginibacter sp.]
MKSIKFYIMLSLASACLMITGCKKFLDEKSDATLVVPTSLTDLQGLLDDSFTMNVSTSSFGDASSDAYFLPEDIYNSRIDRYKDIYRWVPLLYNYPNDWSCDYNSIYVSNVCLERLQKINESSATKIDRDNIRGAALFFRAFYILDLLQEFGKAYDNDSSKTDPGVVLRLNADFNQPSTRATVQECFDQVIKDTREAMTLLPADAVKPLRPSRIAAYALLARTFLFTQKFDSSLKYATLSLTLKNDLLDYNSLNATASVPFKPFNKEIIFYTQMNGYHGTFSTSKAKIDSFLYQEYQDEDLRKQVFFTSSTGYKSYKGSYAANRNLFFSGLATDELYLTAAECKIRLGDVPGALEYLNSLLSNRFKTGSFIPITETGSDKLLNIILNERRKELLFRGIRWADIKRLNKIGSQIILQRKISNEVIQLLPNDKRYALPLPNDIILQTGIRQN